MTDQVTSLPSLRVGVVGAGRVGAVLGAALRAAGVEISAVAAESDASQPTQVNNWVGAGPTARRATSRGGRAGG